MASFHVCLALLQFPYIVSSRLGMLFTRMLVAMNTKKVTGDQPMWSTDVRKRGLWGECNSRKVVLSVIPAIHGASFRRCSIGGLDMNFRNIAVITSCPTYVSAARLYSRTHTHTQLTSLNKLTCPFVLVIKSITHSSLSASFGLNENNFTSCRKYKVFVELHFPECL